MMFYIKNTIKDITEDGDNNDGEKFSDIESVNSFHMDASTICSYTFNMYFPKRQNTVEFFNNELMCKILENIKIEINETFIDECCNILNNIQLYNKQTKNEISLRNTKFYHEYMLQQNEKNENNDDKEYIKNIMHKVCYSWKRDPFIHFNKKRENIKKIIFDYCIYDIGKMYENKENLQKKRKYAPKIQKTKIFISSICRKYGKADDVCIQPFHLFCKITN